MDNTENKATFNISDVDNMDGYEFEEFCCRLLELNGYTNVINTQASGDYGLDIIATTPEGFVCGIQCKNYQGAVGIEAVQQALSGINYYKECNVAVVLTNSTFTRQSVQMADETNVKLWDRDMLIRLMQVLPEKTIAEKTTPPKDFDMGGIDKLKGINFLRLCYFLLKQNGFTDVRINKHSDDEVFPDEPINLSDYTIKALKGSIRYNVKCISGKGNTSEASVTESMVRDIKNEYNQEAVDMSNQYINSAYVILTNGYFTREAVDFAKKNNIELWDRNKFIELIEVFPADYISKLNKFSIPTDAEFKALNYKLETNDITDGELKNLCYAILQVNEAAFLEELPTDIDGIFLAGESVDGNIGVFIVNSHTVLEDDIVNKARELWDELSLDAFTIITSGTFSDNARKASVMLEGIFSEEAYQSARRTCKKTVVLWDKHELNNGLKKVQDKRWIWGCLIGIVLLIIVGIVAWKFLGWFIPVIGVALVLVVLGAVFKQ